jgi:hypothetical protein
MTERNTKAFEFASDTTKLILSLSTGIITVVLTFNEKILKNIDVKWILITSIIFLLISILAGLMVMMALTGNLSEEENDEPSISSPNIRIPSVIQILSFIISMILFSVHIIRIL